MKNEAIIPYEELTDKQKLKHFWPIFCDADPVPDCFLDDMESAKYIALRAVTKRDLEEISFPEEKNIHLGGVIFVLTPLGEKAFRE